MLGSGDPRWCFRTLIIFGASGLWLIAWFMPETARSVVGHGAVPAQGIWRTWWSLLARRRLARNGEKQQPRAGTTTSSETDPALYPDTIVTLWLAACPYALWFCVHASISPVFGGKYGFAPLYVGLCFLPGGAGIIAGGFVAGRLLDYHYKHVARAAGHPADRSNIDFAVFPIERARSRGSIVIVAFSLGGGGGLWLGAGTACSSGGCKDISRSASFSTLELAFLSTHCATEPMLRKSMKI